MSDSQLGRQATVRLMPCSWNFKKSGEQMVVTQRAITTPPPFGVLAANPRQKRAGAVHAHRFLAIVACRESAFAVAIGVKRTCPFALHMSASEPKRRTFVCQIE